MGLPSDPASWGAIATFITSVGVPTAIVFGMFAVFVLWFFRFWIPQQAERENTERAIFKSAMSEQVKTCEAHRQESETRFVDAIDDQRKDFLAEQQRVADRTTKVLDSHAQTVHQLFNLVRELSGRK